jgi:hypothetical protein
MARSLSKAPGDWRTPKPAAIPAVHGKGELNSKLRPFGHQKLQPTPSQSKRLQPNPTFCYPRGGGVFFNIVYAPFWHLASFPLFSSVQKSWLKRPYLQNEPNFDAPRYPYGQGH